MEKALKIFQLLAVDGNHWPIRIKKWKYKRMEQFEDIVIILIDEDWSFEMFIHICLTAPNLSSLYERTKHMSSYSFGTTIQGS